MKILLAHYKYYVQGGPERYMFNFMKLAQENGCEVIPFSVNYPTNVQTEYSKYFVGSKDAGGNYDASNHKLSYLFKNVYHEFHNKEAYKKIVQLIKDTKPDVLYSLIPGQLTPDIFKAAHKMGVPVVLRISDFRLICGKYSMILGENVCDECIGGKYSCCVKHRCVKGSKLLSLLRAKSLAYHRRYRSYRFVDAVIVPPLFTKNLLVRDGFFKEEDIFVNPTFVEPHSISLSSSAKPYLLCLGRYAPEKGFKYAIKALKLIKDTNIRLVITGDIEDVDAETKSFMIEENLLQRIVFTGFVTGKQLEDIICESFAVIAPAIWFENMPNAVLEAYSYGKPVIASSIGCFPDLVIDKKTGLLFEPKNSHDLASKIDFLLDDKAIYHNMCQNSYDFCKENFSKNKHWEGFLKTYNYAKNKHTLKQERTKL